MKISSKKATASVIILVILALLITTTALATTTPGYNGDSDKEDLGVGDKDNKDSGSDGLRVSIVSSTNGADVKAIADFSNADQNNIHYGAAIEQTEYYGMGLNKFEYMKMDPSSFETTPIATIKKPTNPFPQIINGEAGAVKDYFTNNLIAADICKAMGVDFEILTDGKHCMVLEPLSFFKFGGENYCLTATECAMLNMFLVQEGISPTLRDKMGNLTNGALPKSMFLEKPQLGILKYGGGGGKYVDDAVIVNRLGVHIYSSLDFGGDPMGGGGAIKPPDKGFPEGPDDKPGKDDKPSSSGEAGADSNNVIIPSSYLNLPKHRRAAGSPPRLSSYLKSPRGPDIDSPTGEQSFTAGNTLDQWFQLFEWGLRDRTLIDRGLTLDRPTELKVAGFVHGSTPSVINWLGKPARTRATPNRVWDNYHYNNVTMHTEDIKYTYSYLEDHGSREDYPCRCPGTGPCVVNHGSHWVANWVRVESSGTYPTKVGGYNYSSKNTVFNDKCSSSLLTNSLMTFDKSKRQGHYTGAVDGTNSVFKFYPYYAMNYYETSNSKPSTLWMLATGERTLSVKDVIDVDIRLANDVDMIAPWSRDKQDAGCKPDSVNNVIKAGSAVQIIPPAAKGKIKYTYYTQDPGFNGTLTDIVIKPEAIASFEKLFTTDAIDLAVYSNVPLTGSLIDYGRNKKYECTVNNGIVKSGTINSYKQKKRDGVISTLKKFDKNSIKVTVTRNNAVAGEQAVCMSSVPNSVAIAGVNAPVYYTGGVLPMMDVTNTSSLLRQGKDINGGTLPWYKEEYEGLLRVEIEGEFTLTEDKNKQTWFEIYPHISDNMSDYNTINNPYNTREGVKDRPIYKGTDFIFGIGLAVNPNNTPNGDVLFVPSPAYTDPFQIRGSVYDNAK